MKTLIESFDGLHEELESMIVDETKITPRQQLEVFSEVMLGWLEEMRHGRNSEPETSAVMVSVDAQSPGQDGIAALSGKLEGLKFRSKEMVARIDEYSAENVKLEEILSGIVVELDKILKIASDPSSDIEGAYGSLERYTALLGEYLSEFPESYGSDVADGGNQEVTGMGELR